MRKFKDKGRRKHNLHLGRGSISTIQKNLEKNCNRSLFWGGVALLFVGVVWWYGTVLLFWAPGKPSGGLSPDALESATDIDASEDEFISGAPSNERFESFRGQPNRRADGAADPLAFSKEPLDVSRLSVSDFGGAPHYQLTYKNRTCGDDVVGLLAAALRMGVIPKSTKSITCKGILNRGHTCAETHPFCQKTCGSCLQLYECSDNEIGLLVEGKRIGIVQPDTAFVTCPAVLDMGFQCVDLHPFCDKTCGCAPPCSDDNVGLVHSGIPEVQGDLNATCPLVISGGMTCEEVFPFCNQTCGCTWSHFFGRALTAPKMLDCNKGLQGYLSQLRRRQYLWKLKQFTCLSKACPWQHAVNNKLVGYLFARHYGVKTPRLFGCYPGGVPELPVKWNYKWGKDFVIKPLAGHSMKGVHMVVDGRDIFSGEISRGLDGPFQTALGELGIREKKKPYIVEELVKGVGGYYVAYESAPTEYKFFMFGEHIGAIAVVYGIGTDEICMAWFDGNYKRMAEDCVFCTTCSYEPNVLGQCDSSRPAKPRNWGAIKAVAIKLGRALGVHYRVDILGSPNGPVLLEFTPWHANGLWHCAVDSQDDGTTWDPCVLEKAWKRLVAENKESPPAPRIHSYDFYELAEDLVVQCHLLGGLEWAKDRLEGVQRSGNKGKKRRNHKKLL